MSDIPVNLATLSMVRFTMDIIEWLEENPDIWTAFRENRIQSFNSPEALQQADAFSHLSMRESIDEARRTTKRTAEAISMLFGSRVSPIPEMDVASAIPPEIMAALKEALDSGHNIEIIAHDHEIGDDDE